MTEARPEIKKKILSLRHTPSYWLDRARRTRDPRRITDRVLFYRKALEESGQPRILLELADVYCTMQCFDAADRCILKALTLDPSLGDGWYLLGRTALARGDEETSQNAFDRCMRCAPGSPGAVRAQEMLAGYGWKRSRPIPRMGFRAEYLSRLADKATDDRDRALLLVLALRRTPTPEVFLKLLTLCMPSSPALTLHFLPVVLRDRALVFDAMLLGARARARIGKNPVPCLWKALPYARTVTGIQRFFRAGLDCGVPVWTLHALKGLLKDAPWNAGLYEMCAACAEKAGLTEEAARFRHTLSRIDPDRDEEKKDGEADRSAALLREMAVYRNRLRTGRLNRLLHLMTFSLKDLCSVREVYRIAIPLYRSLGRHARLGLESAQAPVWRRAFAACIAFRAGNLAGARRILEGQVRGKDLMRKLRRIDPAIAHRASMLLDPRSSHSADRKGRFIDEMHQF